jgi:hypothetical protein
VSECERNEAQAAFRIKAALRQTGLLGEVWILCLLETHHVERPEGETWWLYS